MKSNRKNLGRDSRTFPVALIAGTPRFAAAKKGLLLPVWSLITLLVGFAAQTTLEAQTTFNGTVNFDDPVPTAEAKGAGVWYPDRYRPSVFASDVLSGENVLKVAVDAADGAQGRPSGYGSTFYNTQGRKFDLPAGTFAVAADLFFPASYEGLETRRSVGIWATGRNASDAVSYYPIAGIANNDGTPVLRYWDGINGVYVTVPITPQADTWYRIEMRLSENNLLLSIDGEQVAELPANGSVSLSDVMFQVYNYNDSNLGADLYRNEGYEAFFDNFSYAYPEIRNLTSNTVHATLGAAIDAASEGEIIELAPGVYTEEVSVTKAVTIRGAKHGVAAGSSPGDRGSNESIVVGGFIVSASGAVLDGLTIQDGRSTGGVNVGVAVAASGVTVTNTIIEDVLSPAQSDGLSTQTGNNNLTLTNSTIRNNWRGIYLNPGSGHVLSGNLIDGNNGSGVGIGSDGQSNLTLTGNTISNHDLEGWGASAVGSGVVASGNSFLDNGVSVAHYGGSAIDANGNYWGSADGPGDGVSGDVVAVAYFTTTEMDAEDLYSPVTNVTATSYHATIQAAINAATSGDHIEVAAGTFQEDVLVNKPLTLIGAGPGQTVLSGPIGGSGGNTVQVASSNVTVAGFTITREGNNLTDWNNPSLNSAGVGMNAPSAVNILIRDNLITAMRTGIDINNTSDVTVRNNVITNNRTGMILRNKTDDLSVEENEITDNWTVGILFLDASGGSNAPLQQAVGSVFTNNDISGNWYGQIVDRQTGGALPAPGANPKDFTKNWLGSLAPSLSTANSAEPGYTDQIPEAFGGTATPPEVQQPDIAGTASANLVIVPLLASGADTDIETQPGRGTYGFQGDPMDVDAPAKNITGPGDPVLYPSLHAAFDAAAPGDTIELISAVHTGAPLTLNKPLTIVGANAGLAGDDEDRGPESILSNMKLTVTAAGVVIDGVEIHQTDNTTDAILLQAEGTVQNSVIRRFGVSTGTFARGITTASGLSGYTITGNLFTGDPSGGMFGGHKTWNSGIYLNGGSGTISGNVFENCRTAINSDDFNAGIVITANLFRDCGTYLAFGGTTPTTGAFAVSGNEFGIDWITPALPSAFFNNSNVASSFRLDLGGNTFGGTASGALADSQKFAIEARNYHRGRSGRNGVVDFVAGEQIVMPGTTIQSAINASAAGDRVLIGSATFAENVVTTVPLTVEGSGATTVIAATAGVGVSLAAGTDATTRSVLKNLAISGDGSATGIVAGSYTTLEGVSSTGHTLYGVNLNAGTDLVIDDCHFDNNNVGLKLASTASFTSIAITDSSFDGNTQHGWYDDANSGVQPLLDDVTIVNTSFSGNGLKGLYTERLSNALLDGVLVSGNANRSDFNFSAGIDINLKWRAFNSITVRNSTFLNNGNGSANGVALTVKARDDAPSYSSPASSFAGLLIEDCVFADNERHYVNGEPGKSNAGPTGVVIQRNRFGATTSGAVVNHSLAQVEATHNFWGTANPDFDALVTGDVDRSPWYADYDLTFLVSESNFEDFTVDEGETLTFEGPLFVGAGTVWTVKGSLVVNGPIELAPGATLEVIDGDVVLSDGSVLSGTFTFFNSFGSVNFNDDVTISGSASGLILVADVHVADGATITVEGPGSFTIDGCVVDSDGTFDLVVESGAGFTMARTAFSDGNIVMNSGATEIYDNVFDETDILVNAASNGSRIFHNVFSASTTFTNNGIGTVTEVDAWGNVTSLANTLNKLPLGIDIGGLPPTRTLAAGTAYIQPGDSIAATISVSALQHKIAGVELLLGYNTDYFESDDLGLGGNWDAGALFTESEETNVIGRFNAAIGLDFDFPDSEGTNASQVVADLGLDSKLSAEGTTQVFHRVKFPEDTIEASRLVTGGTSPTYLSPFTSNTGAIVVDGTEPLIDLPGATITQNGDDMTQFITVQGTLEISASAFDELAGIDTSDLADTVVTLVGPATYTATRVSVGAGPNIGGDDYTTFGFEYAVTASTLNGIYNVFFAATDRSGNVTTQSLGSIEINKNEVSATVELEGLAAGPVTRDVTFVFTDGSNGVLETRVRTLVFTAGVADVTFTDVDGTTANLSAKTATHLRKRTGVSFDGDGQASVTYVGADELEGGDLNGDNAVNLLDYSILRFYWLNQVSLVPASAAAEINGDGSVNLTDYQILQSNFYEQGDPQ